MRLWIAGLIAAFAMLSPSPVSRAQVVLDGTIGSGSGPVGPTPDGSITYWIRDDLGERAGANLFFSFSEFGIRAGESASFTAADPTPVDHVIGRVTGASPSLIDGLLRSEVAGADVWLINPRGITFGQDASIDVPASFRASTADSLRFGGPGGPVLGTDPTPPPLLAVDPPSAFGFSSASPAVIRVESRAWPWSAEISSWRERRA
jgi:filamentous hemagglutinin family protein